MSAPSSGEAIDPTTLTVGVLGGTGNQGKGLALRWAAAGIRVIIGSRAAERAENSASEYCEATGVDHVRGTDNATCAAEADVVLAAIPWESHAETLKGLTEPLKGKILIDCVNPIGFDKKGPYPLPVEEGSAAAAGRGAAARDARDRGVPQRLRGPARRPRPAEGRLRRPRARRRPRGHRRRPRPRRRHPRRARGLRRGCATPTRSNA